MAKQPSALLFDLDGTLADTALDFYQAVNQIRDKQNKPRLEHAKIREQVSNGGFALAALAYDTDLDDPKTPEYRQNLLSIYENIIGQTSGLFDGFKTVLEKLEQNHIKWGIVTNKPRYLTELFLQRIKLNAPVVVCPEDVKQAKPAPDSLLLAANQLNIKVEQCWYVGDHLRDIQAAKSANMYAIAATFGYIEETDNIDNWQADDLIDHPLDLLKLLDLQHEN